MSLNLQGSGAGLNGGIKALHLMGYKAAAGSQPVDTPIQVISQSDANTYFGRGSDLARLYAAAVAQVGPGVIDIYCTAITASGTAQTRKIVMAGPATAAGSVDVYICGYRASTQVANGDTNTAISANMLVELNKLLDVPCTFTDSAGTITVTYRHACANGKDLPIIVNIIGATGVTASPGTCTYVAASGSSTGTTSLRIGATTISITNTLDQSANSIATAMAAAINGGAYPITASAATSTVTALYATDRVVNQLAGTTTATSLTITDSFGTAASGAPTITTALSNIAAQRSYRCWATSFDDATTLGTISTHIELYADGLNQKGQKVHVASTLKLATAGALPTDPSPALTASPRYVVDWSPDHPQQAYELAARTAAMVAVEDYYPRNYDGKELKTRGTVPLMAPHAVSRPTPSDQNSALHTYYMTPIIVDPASNKQVVLRGRTTSNSSDQRLWDWSFIDTIDYYRYDLGIFLGGRFKGKSYKVTGTPHSINTITNQSVEDAAYERLKTYDDNDLFDDIESLKDSITANQDPVVPTRINLYIPMRPPINLHQIGVVGGVV